MWKKNRKRLWASIIASVMVCSSVLTDNVVNSIQLVHAEETQEAGKVQQTEAVNATGVDLGNGLVTDSKDSDMFYNSNSVMRDFRDETIYFVMTTRFYDGDPSNNVQCWDGTSYNGDETPWKGDFQGLIDKLDYI